MNTRVALSSISSPYSQLRYEYVNEPRLFTQIGIDTLPFFDIVYGQGSETIKFSLFDHKIQIYPMNSVNKRLLT